MFDRYQDVIERHKTSDLSDSQPTKGNIAGGLTTIEEKALGNIQKIGQAYIVDSVLDKAETPTIPGLHFMDSSSAAAEMVTLCAAAGFAAHFFPTGRQHHWSSVAFIIRFTVRIQSCSTMMNIDIDVSGILRREENMDQAGDKLLECLLRGG
jgi:(2R)-sulfolactate sulfo-lyase subunit beta